MISGLRFTSIFAVCRRTSTAQNVCIPLVNRERAHRNLPPLQVCRELTRSAELHYGHAREVVSFGPIDRRTRGEASSPACGRKHATRNILAFTLTSCPHERPSTTPICFQVSSLCLGPRSAKGMMAAGTIVNSFVIDKYRHDLASSFVAFIAKLYVKSHYLQRN